MSVAIHWFRRDLRITDNTALNSAAAEHEEIVPVYILSEWTQEHRWTGPARQEFLCGCLQELSSSLEAAGGRLIIRQGNEQVAVLEDLVRQSGATAIYFNRDPDPHGRQMEAAVEAMAQRLGIAVHASKDIGLHEREEILTKAGSPFKVFGPYARAWSLQEKPKPGGKLARLKTPAEITSLPRPSLATWKLHSTAEIIKPGETAARQRLESFLKDRIFRYGELRNLPATEGSSRLSQDLRWGLLSIREVYAAACKRMADATPEQRQSISIFLNELAWRDFSLQVLWHFPEVLDREFLPQFRDLQWHAPGETYERWCTGQTGFPIVDAGMRQLTATGFMHNRVRMIVAMFLCKDLHLSWKLGERFFMSHLVDGEIASNNTGWQWCASVGLDAQPYFRIQNPWTQTARHDSDGEYIRLWVPELRDVPVARLNRPPKPGERLVGGYPLPIVVHAQERVVTLETYREAANRYQARG
jgi:deoxyribodipyrimidine photo-lyase